MTFPTIAEIQAAVCTEFGMSRVELLGDRRGPNLARPRQVAMWLAVRLTRHSKPVIASHFRRDHKTLHHALERVEHHIFEADNYGRAAIAIYRRFKNAPISAADFDRDKRRAKPQGHVHRAWIRENITAYLRPGCMLPTEKELGVRLGICQAEAGRHLNRVLAEDRIATIVCAIPGTRGRGRRFVALSPISPLFALERYSIGVDNYVDNLSSQPIEAGL